jgi:hypothetical protein
MKGSYRKSTTPKFWIGNTNMKFKLEMTAIAKSRGMDLATFCRSILWDVWKNAPAQEKKFLDDDGC